MAADMSERVSLAREHGLGPMQDGAMTEGTHYTVLAHTDWCDLFVPTIVKWANGEIDSLKDSVVTAKNAAESRRLVRENGVIASEVEANRPA